ncbi:MAG TPA: hypothetical protein VI959_04740, partial [Alphaproteobacteria bacterium]|nr:hypothetical protein [Alphaproteobacteria bacterium]
MLLKKIVCFVFALGVKNLAANIEDTNFTEVSRRTNLLLQGDEEAKTQFLNDLDTIGNHLIDEKKFKLRDIFITLLKEDNVWAKEAFDSLFEKGNLEVTSLDPGVFLSPHDQYRDFIVRVMKEMIVDYKSSYMEEYFLEKAKISVENPTNVEQGVCDKLLTFNEFYDKYFQLLAKSDHKSCNYLAKNALLFKILNNELKKFKSGFWFLVKNKNTRETLRDSLGIIHCLYPDDILINDTTRKTIQYLLINSAKYLEKIKDDYLVFDCILLSYATILNRYNSNISENFKKESTKKNFLNLIKKLKEEKNTIKKQRRIEVLCRNGAIIEHIENLFKKDEFFSSHIQKAKKVYQIFRNDPYDSPFDYKKFKNSSSLKERIFFYNWFSELLSRNT